MRKFNAILSMSILVLFLIHAVLGGFQLFGLMAGGNTVLSVLAYLMTGMIILHICIGIWFTIQPILIAKKTKTSYVKENKVFWARRISGFAVMFFILFHILEFLGWKNEAGAYRLTYFGGVQLVVNILLIVSLAVHIVSNVKPILISFGRESLKEYVGDILIIVSVLLLFMSAAFIIYYIRWNVI